MEAIPTLLLIGGGYLAYKGISKVSSATTLNFYPAAVKNLAFDGLTPVLTVGIAIQNPSSTSYQVKSIVGNLFANTYLIGNISSYTPVTIAPTGQTIYWVAVRLSLLGITQDIVNAMQGNGIAQEVELNANANVDNFIIPLKIKFHIP